MWKKIKKMWIKFANSLIPQEKQKIKNADIVVDGVFGTGFHGELDGELPYFFSLAEDKTTIAVEDGVVVKDIHEFAREIVWYGRNRRATDYTSTNYKVTKA